MLEGIYSNVKYCGPSLEFLFQGRQKDKQTQKPYHRSLMSWWVRACWRTVPLWRLSRGNHSRTRRWVDRVHRRIDWIKALQESREIIVCQMCTKRHVESGKVHNTDCSRWRASPLSRAMQPSWRWVDSRILHGCKHQDVGQDTLSRYHFAMPTIHTTFGL